MSENKQEALIADLMIRVTILENMLLSKNICSLEELREQTEFITKQVIKSILSS